jgi:hypothetical protein
VPGTYEPINTTTVTSSVTSITFNSIPNTYTDLVLITSAYSFRASNVDSLAIRFNGDSGTNYSYTAMLADTTTQTSARATGQTNIWVGNFTANNFNQPSPIIMQIPNYANTSMFKTVLARGNSVAGGGYRSVNANFGSWLNTAAINSVTVRSETGNNFLSGSTFTLYGIKAA